MLTPDLHVPHFVAPAAEGFGGRPAVVVVMEGNGMSPQLLRVCQRFAAAGYPALAPDLFHRFGGSDPDAAVREHWYGRLRPEEGLEDIAACVAELRRRGASSVGITGFCMGGTFSYGAATRGLAVDAAVPFYGRLAEILDTPSCPLLAFFGGADPFIPRDDIARVEARHPGQVVVYEDADHGFMRDGSPSHHPAAAADAWARTLAFLGEHLR
jgi:carboxymethylenebutenolidase